MAGGQNGILSTTEAWFQPRLVPLAQHVCYDFKNHTLNSQELLNYEWVTIPFSSPFWVDE